MTLYAQWVEDIVEVTTPGSNSNPCTSYTKFVAEQPGYYFAEAWGAQGGNYSSTYVGGKGAYTSGYIYFNKNDTLYLYIGGRSDAINTRANGGYNGGAPGGAVTNDGIYTGGGGASDIRYFGSATPSNEDLCWNSTLGLRSRIMVAAGGAGTGLLASKN